MRFFTSRRDTPPLSEILKNALIKEIYAASLWDRKQNKRGPPRSSEEQEKKGIHYGGGGEQRSIIEGNKGGGG